VGTAIPNEYALCTIQASAHLTLAPNRNPALMWSDLPAGTQSLVLICYDADGATEIADVNREGCLLSPNQRRGRFYHWVLVDLPPQLGSIRAGEFSEGLSRHGKERVQTRYGARQGLNGYTEWFAHDSEMTGKYFGYDGPCPPWNDSIVHHYVFTLYALDVVRCPVEGEFRAVDVLKAISGHVLEQADIVGLYAMNPDVRF